MQYPVRLILTILSITPAEAAAILERSEQEIHEWYEHDRPLDSDQLRQLFAHSSATLASVLKQLDIKDIAASLLECTHREIEKSCKQGSPITLNQLRILLSYYYSHLLSHIIDELALPQARVAELLGCARANINSRYHRHSLITAYEIYRLYQHALEKGWHNKIGVLLPLIEFHFPHLFQSERTLAELIPDIWQQVVVFIPTAKDAKCVQQSLLQDRRNTEKRRQIMIGVPHAGTLLDDVKKLFEHELPLRFELSINQVDHMSFASALMAFTIPDRAQQTLLLLRPADSGFTQLAGEDLRVHREKTMKILDDVYSERNRLYGPVMVNAMGIQASKQPGAAGSNEFILDFKGQLGGRYRLMAVSDYEDNPENETEEHWRMRLTAESDNIRKRIIRIFDQAGHVVIQTQSDNLPWQGLWPDESQPLRVHINDLNITELAAQ